MHAIDETKEIVDVSVLGDQLHCIWSGQWIGDWLDGGNTRNVGVRSNSRLNAIDISQRNTDKQHLRGHWLREGDQRSKAEVIVGDIAESLQHSVVGVQELALELSKELFLWGKSEIGSETVF